MVQVRTFSAAARATLFTTVTSASAFFANYLSEIPALANFGLLTALVVCTNYIWLLMTIPVSLGIWEKWFNCGKSAVDLNHSTICSSWV